MRLVAVTILVIGLGALRCGSAPTPGAVSQRRTLPVLPTALYLLSGASKRPFQRRLLQSPDPQLLPLPTLDAISLALTPVGSETKLSDIGHSCLCWFKAPR